MIRVARFQDNLLKFCDNSKVESRTMKNQFLYKTIEIKDNIKQNVFFLDKVAYGKSIIIRADLKDSVKNKFHAVDLLSAEGYVASFNKPW